ncbi:Uncharacterised protein r2_g2624 [Pycnogonum litorale]
MGSGLVKVIEALYNNNSNAVLTSNNTFDWFRTIVGVRQGYISFPCLFNIFLEQIMTDALEEFTGTVSIGGSQISNLRFADDIDLISGSRKELADLTDRLSTTSNNYGMEISGEKSKMMMATSRKNGTNNAEIKVNGGTLEEAKTFQYLGSTLNEDATLVIEVKKRLAMATSQLAQLNRMWNSNGISIATKMRLLRSLIVSIALYGCETWTYNKGFREKNISI